MSTFSAFDPDGPSGITVDPRGTPPAPPNPLLLVHRGLRGRYPLAIGLGIVLGAVFVTLAYLTVRPQYQSVALIRVAPTQAKIIYQTEDNAQMANWDSFVMAQVSFIQSRRVVQLALANEKLAGIGWPRGGEGETGLSRGLDVGRSRGSEIVSVMFKHSDPAKAQAAVNAVVDAYSQLKDETFGLEAGTQERAIEGHIASLQSKLTMLRRDETAIEAKYGVADLEALHKSKSEMLDLSDRSIQELHRKVKMLEATQPAAIAGEVAPAARQESDLSLAQRSGEFADLLRRRMAIEDAIRDKVELTSEHRERRKLDQMLLVLNSDIDRLRIQLLAEPQAVDPDRMVLSGEPSLPQMKTLLQVLEIEHTQLSEAVRAIGTDRQELQRVRAEKDNLKADLDLASNRLTALEVERNSSKTGRITVMQRGDIPLEPSTNRQVPLMGAGALGGLGLGVGLVWLVGFLSGGCRYATDIQDPGQAAPLIEVLPHLDEATPEWLDLAAHSVHHIRSILNISRPDAQGPLVILVSSATAGEGKSYLSNALAHSFAIAEHKTIVVDADLLGRRLTTRLGFAGQRGLRDAAHENQDPPTYPLDRSLDVLPVGIRDDFQPEQFNRAYFIRALDFLRSRYDTIVIDSGPILGSLEANLIAPLADRTVLVVGRGQSPRMVQAATGRIRQLGGVVAGFVFNRAVRADYLTSSYSASVSRQSLISGTTRPRPRPANAPASPLLLSMRSSLSGEDRERRT